MTGKTPLRHRTIASSKPFAQIEAGERVELVSTANNKDGVWCFVRSSAGEGWIPAAALHTN